MAESTLSTEVTAKTLLPDPSSVTVTSVGPSPTIGWAKNDNSSDGEIRVEASTDGGSTHNEIASGLAPTTTSYTHTGATYAQEYVYRIVRATDHETATSTSTDPVAKPSDLSSEVQTTAVLPDPTNVTAELTGSDEITVTWTNNTTVGSIAVAVSTDKKQSYSQVTSGLSSSTTSYTHTNLPDSNTYAYKVTVSTDHASASDESGIITRSPENASATVTSEDNIDVSWDGVNNATEYRVYRAISTGSSFSDYTQIGTTSSGTTTYTDTTSVDGEENFYRVSAVVNSSETGLSNEAVAQAPLPAPTFSASGLTYQPDTAGVDISWSLQDNNPNGTVDVERGVSQKLTTETINGEDVAVEYDDYGKWVCVLNYEHYGGENPSVSPGSTFPQLPDGKTTAADIDSGSTSGELRHVDNIEQYGSWNVDAVRLEATTVNHDRKIHYFTENRTVIDAIVADNTSAGQSALRDQTTFYDDHTANLPDAGGNQTDSRSDRIFGYGFPMYEGGNHHWAVAGFGDRWEVDDYPSDASQSTVHRVWVRVGTGSGWETVAGGIVPTTTTTTDTDITTGETYTYRIVRITDHATATSDTATIQTALPITVDGMQVIDITVNGNSVTGLTIDGTTIF